jgi:hypothetical protein
MVDTKFADTVSHQGMVTEQTWTNSQEALVDSRRGNFVR